MAPAAKQCLLCNPYAGRMDCLHTCGRVWRLSKVRRGQGEALLEAGSKVTRAVAAEYAAATTATWSSKGALEAIRAKVAAGGRLSDSDQPSTSTASPLGALLEAMTCCGRALSCAFILSISCCGRFCCGVQLCLRAMQLPVGSWVRIPECYEPSQRSGSVGVRSAGWGCAGPRSELGEAAAAADDERSFFDVAESDLASSEGAPSVPVRTRGRLRMCRSTPDQGHTLIYVWWTLTAGCCSDNW